jgi:hypothetical protein
VRLGLLMLLLNEVELSECELVRLWLWLNVVDLELMNVELKEAIKNTHDISGKEKISVRLCREPAKLTAKNICNLCRINLLPLKVTPVEH